MLYAFDIDGTLIRSFLDDRDGRLVPVQDYAIVEPLGGRTARLAELRRNGHDVVLITNQAGAAFGHQTIAEIDRKIERVRKRFALPPENVYMAVMHPNATVEALRGDDGRKPDPALLLQAMVDHDATAGQTMYVGDMDSDRECAERAGVPYVDARAFFGSDA